MPYDAKVSCWLRTFGYMPRADDSVFVDAVLVENPSPLGPLGIRGVGEPPIVPGGAAVANAVREVTGCALSNCPLTQLFEGYEFLIIMNLEAVSTMKAMS